jgi:uncharacterized protein YciI
MGNFLYKLIPPRPTFPQDMTEAEQKIMQEHVMYWKGLIDEGTAIVFGPVAEPSGAWGLAIVEVEDEAAVHAIAMNDPTIKANAGFDYKVCPMPQGVIKK